MVLFQMLYKSNYCNLSIFRFIIILKMIPISLNLTQVYIISCLTENELKIGGHRARSRNKWTPFRYFTAKYVLFLNLWMIDIPKPVLIKPNFNIFIKIIILRTTVK